MNFLRPIFWLLVAIMLLSGCALRPSSSHSIELAGYLTSLPPSPSPAPTTAAPAGTPTADPAPATAVPTRTPTTEAEPPTPTLSHEGPTPTLPGDWQLVFSDEFDGTTLDQQYWSTCFWWGESGCTIKSNNELQWYQPENVTLAAGILRLTARQSEIRAPDGKLFAYTSGMISTGPRASNRRGEAPFAFQYGYVEIRARVPAGRGFWPAFWLLPTNLDSTPEIDIMESLGNDTGEIMTYFHYTDSQGKAARAGQRWRGPDFSQTWNRFGLEWRPEALIWYLNNVELQRFEQVEFIPELPMYLILNLAVGGNYPGDPDPATTFPSSFEIDYVRVYQESANDPRPND